MGGDLLVEVVHIADQRDDIEFFQWAFGQWGPVIEAVMVDYRLRELGFDRMAMSAGRLEIALGVRLPAGATGVPKGLSEAAGGHDSPLACRLPRV